MYQGDHHVRMGPHRRAAGWTDAAVADAGQRANWRAASRGPDHRFARRRLMTSSAASVSDRLSVLLLDQPVVVGNRLARANVVGAMVAHASDRSALPLVLRPPPLWWDNPLHRSRRHPRNPD